MFLVFLGRISTEWEYGARKEPRMRTDVVRGVALGYIAQTEGARTGAMSLRRKLWEALLRVLPLVTILSVLILAKYVVDLVVVPHLELISEWIARNHFFILWAFLYIFVAVGFFVLVFPVGFLILVYNKRRFSHNVGVAAGNLVAGKPGVGPPVIRGAAIIARTKIEVPPDQPLDYHWEGHGLKVHIPAGAIVGERGPVTMAIPVGFLVRVYNEQRFSYNVGVARNLVAGKPDVGPPVIRGAAIIARAKFEITPYQPSQDYQWNSKGFKVHIPEGAIISGEGGPVTLYIQASLTGYYDFPDDGVLVSGVYWLSLHPHVEKFKKKVTITIQHCASDADSELAFVTAKCTQAMLPYTFKTLSSDHSDAEHKVQPYTSKSLSEGSFSEGTIEVDHFSAFAIFSFLRLRKNYAFCTYYIQKQLNCYEAHITVTPDLALQMKVGGIVNKFLI